jgi:hypothetical protein
LMPSFSCPFLASFLSTEVGGADIHMWLFVLCWEPRNSPIMLWL